MQLWIFFVDGRGSGISGALLVVCIDDNAPNRTVLRGIGLRWFVVCGNRR
jgi:hypothetical protein